MLRISRTKLAVLLVLVLLALAEPRAIAYPTDADFDKEVVNYTVEPGDNFWSIGLKFGVSPDILAQSNSLQLSEPLQVGQNLQVPEIEQGKFYRVQAGESLWSIASLNGTSVSLLIRANGMNEPDHLKVGQVLKLPVKSSEVSRGDVKPSSSVAFQWPLNGTLTSSYGWRRGEFHTGIDIGSERGTEIRAARAGTVVFAGRSNGYGLVIRLDHGDGYSTLYAHSSKILVEVGDRVTQGQSIAKVGSTGNSTGPHLHFEVRYGNKTSNPLDLLTTTTVASDS